MIPKKCKNPDCWCNNDYGALHNVWYTFEKEHHESMKPHQCQTCGEHIGYLGRMFRWMNIPIHKCKK